MDAGRRDTDLDPAALLEQVRADRHRRLTTAAAVALAALVAVTLVVVLVAVAGIGSPPVGLTIALGLCWLIALTRAPSIGWRP